MKVQLNALVDRDIRETLKVKAAEQDRSLNWYVNDLLKKHLEPTEKPKTKAIKKAEPDDTALQSLCRQIWKAYSEAFYSRYGVEPVRNMKVNSQIKQIAQRLGEEAIYTIGFYVGINDAWLVKNSHSIGSFLQNAESYLTQARTGRAITGNTARTVEKTQSAIDAVEEARRILDGNY